MAKTIPPNELVVRSYQVGFGDCFLLTFRYPPGMGGIRMERHVLIDFGSSGSPKNFGGGLLDRVAADIRRECGGKLHVVAATHRHLDHINGFATRPDGRGPGDVIRSCAPELVLLPWTEDPDAEPDARVPTRSLSVNQARVRSLREMQAFADAVLTEVRRPGAMGSKRVRDQLSFLGEDNLTNLSAVKNLMTLGRSPAQYLYFGRPLRISSLLPGVKVHVLGPPTLEQSEGIRRERAIDETEFWRLAARQGARLEAARGPLFPRAPKEAGNPPYTRWLIPRIQAAQVEQTLELVRILDDALNNTSLILLFEVGGQRLLFPGDAQIENWSYALGEATNRPALKTMLRGVTFYKVGHHGSLNATPKTLWNLFRNRDIHPRPGRLQSVVSTMAGKHGSEDRGTEVPRKPLLAALRAETDFFTTQDLKKKSQLKKVFTLPL